MTYTSDDLAALIRDDSVHRAVYTDPEIFELEMRRIWGRAWIYIAHESQIPEKGQLLHDNAGAPAGAAGS